MNSDIKAGEHDLLSFIRPDTLIGALAYLVIFVFLAHDPVARHCARPCTPP